MSLLSFGANSIARDYDTHLVPALFDPWAALLIEDHQPWRGRRVLDLATGTGIVASKLAEAVGATGRVTAADVNEQMLAIARTRCPGVTFLQASAEALDLESGSQDAVVCQQGFQFFPDRSAAAKEIRRVLRPGGRVIVSAWRPTTECRYFGAVCDSLDRVGEPEIARKMRVPFDHLPAAEMQTPFETAGFEQISLRRVERDLVLPRGMDQALELAYGLPIGGEVRALSEDSQVRFRRTLVDALERLSPDGVTMGRMVSLELTAVRPS